MAQTIPTETVTYTRQKGRDGAVNETGLPFDDSVPVRIIVLSDPALEAIAPSERELIGEKVTHRLAQHPGSYEVLKYVRPVYKILATQEVICVPAPTNVLDRCVADLAKAVVHGALLRVRPVMTTVATIIAGLLPIMFGSGTGSEVMRRIAAPMIGGMINATILTLGIIPAIFFLWQRRRLRV